MKSVGILLGLGLLFSSALASDLLSPHWDAAALKSVLHSPSAWCRYPAITDRRAWEALPEAIRLACVARGEAVAGRDTSISATDFLAFSRSGQRANYEGKYFPRRYELSELVVAECVEGKGRFLDEIIDRVWSICEESSWALPAHMGSQQAGVGLPDPTEPMLDVMAAETAGVLAWTRQLLAPAFDQVSPMIGKRIVYEVERRVLAPGRERNDFWWMGFDGRVPNNWNTIIVSHWLAAALLLTEDESVRAADVARIIRIQDNFMAGMPADGSCDEGPMYWIGSAGALYQSFDLLAQSTHGAVDGFAIPVVREAGRYVYRLQISDDQYVNLGDAHRRQRMPADLIYRYGIKINDAKLSDFGAALARDQKLYQDGLKGLLLPSMLPALFGATELLAAGPAARYPLPRDVWMPDLGLMVARSEAGSVDGFFLAVQAGHNGKRHNHNDTGNFTVYHEGEPVLIDLGSARYEARTFGDQRYDIWVNQSGWHNTPTVDAIMQSAGKEYAAGEWTYQADDQRAELAFELARAYPAAAKISTWRRSVTLERAHGVRLRDRFELNQAQSVDFNFITALQPVIEKGRIVLRSSGGTHFALEYDDQTLVALVESISVEDPWLRHSWGPQVHRIILRSKAPIAVGNFEFRVGVMSR